VRYLEDMAVGEQFELGSFSLTAEDIVAFAQRYDPQPFHLQSDPDGPYGGLIAGGRSFKRQRLSGLAGHYDPLPETGARRRSLHRALYGHRHHRIKKPTRPRPGYRRAGAARPGR
jgi:acyl dehydratase